MALLWWSAQFDFSVIQAQHNTNPTPESLFYSKSGIQTLDNSSQYGDLAPGTYLVSHDILIEKGRTLSLYPGTRILLTQNAMIVVNGTFRCTGTTDAPVFFQRLDNTKYFQPIDPRVETRWDGIYLPDSAVLEMRNTIISDSKYGIVVSGRHVRMRFDSTLFINNKFQNVKIGDRMLKVPQHSPFVFHYPEERAIFVEPVAVKNVTETIQQKNKQQSSATSYPKLRTAMTIVAGAGLAAAVTGFVVHRQCMNRYNETVDEKYLSGSDAGSAIAVGGAIIFGIGAVGVGWTFFY